MDIGTVTCPFCGKEYLKYEEIRQEDISADRYSNKLIIRNEGTTNRYYFNINGCGYQESFFSGDSDVIYGDCDGGTYELTISCCSHCKKEEITIRRCNIKTLDDKYLYDEDLIVNVRPKFNGKIFPEYVPQAIRQNYKEATTILKLSPKASAILSIICIREMIRDRFGINNKNNLQDEIKAIQDNDLISKEVLNALNNLCDIGNIDANMEKDVDLIDIDEGKAKGLIKFIEYFINEWYIQVHNRVQFIKEITEIGKGKI